MSTILPSQIIPPASEIKDGATRSWAERVVRFLDETLRKVAMIPFNRSEKLSVGDSGNADTEFSVTHHLMRVPDGFIVTRTDKAGIIYDSGKTWTTTTIYLKCSAANAALDLYVF